MSIGSIAAYAADRGLSAPAATRREDAEPERLVAPSRRPDAATPLAGLANGSEAQRLDSLLASARAAAVRLVTDPLPSAQTEGVRPTIEQPAARADVARGTRGNAAQDEDRIGRPAEPTVDGA